MAEPATTPRFDYAHYDLAGAKIVIFPAMQGRDPAARVELDAPTSRTVSALLTSLADRVPDEAWPSARQAVLATFYEEHKAALSVEPVPA